MPNFYGCMLTSGPLIDVLALVEENCNYSQFAGVLCDLDHVVITEVATIKGIQIGGFPALNVCHHGVVIPSNQVLNGTRELGAVKSSSTVRKGKF